MKNYIICALIGFFGMVLFLVIKNSDSDSGSSYPITYYYNQDTGYDIIKHSYIINLDKTAKIQLHYKSGKASKNFDTYWQEGSDGSYWIKSDLYGFEVIKENVLYMSPDDSKSKRNGTPLIKQ